MSGVVLDVKGLGKAYQKHESSSARFLGWLGFRQASIESKWVLRHVSFSLGGGDAVGIVGQNGAGKSTLLKLLTGTTRQTEGAIWIGGRVSAILELGMGFNPDFTGRENARHALGLMGCSAQQADALLGDIEAFAEIDEYFDMPLRVYSSGMQMRVAFAVATAVRPEVLIVDEALSVGDAYFQHKSFNRIREYQKLGTSLLIVSHDRSAIQSLCSRVILLDHGRIIKDGPPEEVMDYYNAMIAQRENEDVIVTRLDDGRVQTSSGTGEAKVDSIVMLNDNGDPIDFCSVGQRVRLRISIAVYNPIDRLVLGYMIKDRLGMPMYGTNTHHTQQAIEHVKAGDRFEADVQFEVNLGPGTYSISTALVSTDTHLVNNYEWRDLAFVFTVANLDKPLFVGSSYLPPMITLSAQ